MFELFSSLIPLAPLAGCIVCTVLALSERRRETAHIPAIIALGISAVSALGLLVTFHGGEAAVVRESYRFLAVGDTVIDIALRFDSLTTTMLAVITSVSFLVCIYSQAYMHGDPGFSRYFAVFCGFVFSMTMLVMASNLIVLYAFWEAVGTCSYLLIGFWFRKPSAANAATKAFLVNRLADTGFFLAILAAGYYTGLVGPGAGSFFQAYDFDTFFRLAESIALRHPDAAWWIGIGLILGAIGKSAQFPLHVWLPDAMEGPTPVSALIHAATMVTAGVYLTARMMPFLTFVPDALILVGYLGAITSLMAAVMALFQDDLKRVLAYSTVSQLGYLFMALSCGAEHDLVLLAIFAALFHLVTHAFFKALLFLGAGSVMHAMGDVIDMREFSGLRSVLPKTHWLFAIGAATLAGFPLLAAFFSKDAILALLWDSGESALYGRHFQTFAVIGFITAFLTAIYSSRAYFRTFWGPLRLPVAAGHHPHEATPAMWVPMAILAVASVFSGLILGPTGWLLHYVEQIPSRFGGEIEHHESLVVMFFSGLLAVLGIAIGYVATTLSRSTDPVVRPNAFVNFAQQRLYIDWLYRYLIVAPFQWLASVVAWFDEVVVDGASTLIGVSPAAIGTLLRQGHAGRVPAYAMFSLIGVVVLAFYFVVFR